MKTRGGLSGLGLGLSALWTEDDIHFKNKCLFSKGRSYKVKYRDVSPWNAFLESQHGFPTVPWSTPLNSAYLVPSSCITNIWLSEGLFPFFLPGIFFLCWGFAFGFLGFFGFGWVLLVGWALVAVPGGPANGPQVNVLYPTNLSVSLHGLFGGQIGQSTDLFRGKLNGTAGIPRSTVGFVGLCGKAIHPVKNRMTDWREKSSFGTLLPLHWQQPNGTPAPQAQPAVVQSTPTSEKPVKKKSLLQRLPRINTTVQRHGSDALVMSPSGGTTASPVEAAELDGTFDQMVPEKKKKRNHKKGQLSEGKTLVEEEKPGEGNVWDVWARLPRDARRWEKPANIPVAHVPIPAGSICLNRPSEALPEGWTMYIHPEGKPYYHRDAREPESTLLVGTNLYGKGKAVSRPLEIVTDSDPRDPVTRKTLEHAHFIAQVTIAENEVELPDRVELFLELYPADEPDLHPYAGYYLVDHTNQVVFWGAASTTNDLGAFRVNPGTFSDHHLKLQLRQQYWSHLEMYPLETSINLEAANEELMEQLAFMYMDVSTSQTSTSPWTDQQCQAFISMLHLHWQFQNLYGHPAARLDRTHSYEVEVAPVTPTNDSKEPSLQEEAEEKSPSLRARMETLYTACLAIFLRICCVLLFDAPAAHNEALEKVWVDKIVHKIRFQHLIDRTVKDWGDVSLLSTVLWTANMAFLAIPYPILNPQLQEPVTDFEKALRLAMITASLCSTVFSVGSIAISLLHIRKHRVDRTADEYCDFLETQHHYLYGHRPLAMIWSLPYAFLMWSVVSFSAAIMLFCVNAGGMVTEIALLALSGCMTFCILVSIWYFWKRETKWTSSVDGRPSFRMQFTDWLWDLRLTKNTLLKTT
ncbi:hypothetical protein M408DRAFT_8509 [Serendipita vermifera MAFF 305830]|uniref:WW domain-containing protein n=1 Tax=Serendipita vermifera MAFF 305830 TaxID=933852 RepID=A0A0C2WR85_SERVB|nr:hypothetical protein M408DRAFT_8509 [Serendipita vermifera MAFF 305830]